MMYYEHGSRGGEKMYFSELIEVEEGNQAIYQVSVVSPIGLHRAAQKLTLK